MYSLPIANGNKVLTSRRLKIVVWRIILEASKPRRVVGDLTLSCLMTQSYVLSYS